jgi:hypothetical protein
MKMDLPRQGAKVSQFADHTRLDVLTVQACDLVTVDGNFSWPQVWAEFCTNISLGLQCRFFGWQAVNAPLKGGALTTTAAIGQLVNH